MGLRTYKMGNSSWAFHKRMLDLGHGLPDRALATWRKAMRNEEWQTLFEQEPFEDKELRCLELKLTMLYFVRTFFQPYTEKDVMMRMSTYRLQPPNFGGLRDLITMVGEDCRHLKGTRDYQEQKWELVFLYVKECYNELYPRLFERYQREMERERGYITEVDFHLDSDLSNFKWLDNAVEGLARMADMVRDQTVARYQPSPTFSAHVASERTPSRIASHYVQPTLVNTGPMPEPTREHQVEQRMGDLSRRQMSPGGDSATRFAWPPISTLEPAPRGSRTICSQCSMGHREYLCPFIDYMFYKNNDHKFRFNLKKAAEHTNEEIDGRSSGFRRGVQPMIG